MPRCLALAACLLTLPALAEDLTVGVGETLVLRAAAKVTVRDAALLEVRTTETNALAVYGKTEGVTGIRVHKTNGDLEHLLVFVTTRPAPVAQPELTRATTLPLKVAPAQKAAADRAMAEAHSALAGLSAPK